MSVDRGAAQPLVVIRIQRTQDADRLDYFGCIG
jgi:hypothetical protein